MKVATIILCFLLIVRVDCQGNDVSYKLQKKRNPKSKLTSLLAKESMRKGD